MRAQAWSAIIAALVSLAWLLSRTSYGVAAGPWLGAFLDPHPLNDLPTISALLARALGRFGGGSLNLASALFGAVSCSLVAALAARALARACSTPKAVFCAVLGTAFYATSAPMVQAGSAAGPSTVTVALAMAAALALVLAHDAPKKGAYLALAGLASGLAAANHPSFALLYVLSIGTALALDPAPRALITRVPLITFAFAAGASVPALLALAAGESLPSFLRHALRTPYPTIGDRRPSLTVFRAMVESGNGALLALAAPGVLAVTKVRMRYHAILCLGVLLCFGPLLPFLTNHYGADYGLRDDLAPRIMVAAMLGISIAWGIALVSAAWASRFTSLGNAASALGVGFLAVLLIHQALAAPNRRPPAAGQFARRVLQSCPENGALICRDSRAACFLKGAQFVENSRPDVTVLSLDALVDPQLRTRLAHVAGDSMTLDGEFDPQAHLDEYGVEQPFLIQELSRKGAESALSDGALAALAIWDFTRNNAPDRPICFVGVSVPWLGGRAREHDCLLVYPQTLSEPSSGSRGPETLASATLPGQDPDLDCDIQDVLLSLSDAARDRGDANKAIDLANRALPFGPRNPAVHLALSRSEAREGRRDQAERHVRAYLGLATQAGAADQVLADIEQALQIYSLDAQFTQGIEAVPAVESLEQRSEVTGQLWQFDQIETLNRGYAKLLAQKPNDVGLLYERAAIQAQLGDLQAAGQTLRRWQTAGAYSDETLKARINLDGRFALIYLPERKAEDADMRAYVESMIAPPK